jgi:hypothetical protein
MSLKKEDWKRVLDQPKNLGLKAGGTGVSDLMEKLKTAEDDFARETSLVNGQKVRIALSNLQKRCNEVIKKHKKLFTTACTYLEGVVTEATARNKAVEDRERDVRDLGFAKQQFKEACTKADRALAILQISSHDLEQLLDRLKLDIRPFLDRIPHASITPGWTARMDELQMFRCSSFQGDATNLRGALLSLVKKIETEIDHLHLT